MRPLLVLLLVVACSKSSPPPASERPRVNISAGNALVPESSCSTAAREERLQPVGTFVADRDLVSCAEWRACVAAKRCKDRRSEFCENNIVYVRREGAEEFCQWHDARLLSVAEWVRAARGEGRELQRDDSEPCVPVLRSDRKAQRCPYRGPTGFQFSGVLEYEAEWTSDGDCMEPGDGGFNPVAIGFDAQNLFRVLATVSAFRCAASTTSTRP